jgi:murein DD-endopeptidase MepM/ murein hydrolase activator NlpD
MALGPRTRVLLIAAVVFAALGALVWYLSVEYWAQPVTPLTPPKQDAAQEAVTPLPLTRPPAETTATPLAGATATPSSEATPAAAMTPLSMPTPNAPPAASPQAQNPANDPSASPASAHLLIPVEGVKPEQLRDTFSDARSEGRVHDAIDIMAPRGAHVLAAADGRVLKLFQSAKGGITIYQLGADEHTVFYYAHLAGYADGLVEGHVARRGETIGYVGDTGNAAPGNTHLHFQIYRVADPKHFWNGDNLNPYPLLRNAQ